MGRPRIRTEEDLRRMARERYHKNKDRVRERERSRLRARPKDHPTRVKAREYAAARRLANPGIVKNSDRKTKLKRYGLTLDQFADQLALQNNACEICRTSEWGQRGPCVDHDHKTGIVRGLLCSRCNLALGHFRDDIDCLKRAIAYLGGKA